MLATILRRLLLAAIVALGVALPTKAAGFDCARARAADEIAICKSPALSELDAVAGALWFAASRIPVGGMGSSGARLEAARGFLAARATCGGDAACLTRSYRTRIAELRTDIDAGMTAVVREQNVEPSPAFLPPPVAALVAGYGGQCRQLGGTLAGRPRVMTADLDGDGLPDYVLDTRPLRCDAAATAFCANNGCQVGVAVSGNRYFEATPLTGGDPAIVSRAEQTELVLMVDRSNCPDAVPGDACRASTVWVQGRPRTTYALRR